MIMTLKGTQKCQILINSGSDFNIICQSLMKKWRINSNWEPKGHPFAINEKKLFDYGIHDFKIHTYDCNRQINAYCRSFYAVKISEVDIILDYL